MGKEHKKPKILIFVTDPLIGKLYMSKLNQVGFEAKDFYSYVKPNVVELVVKEKPDILWCDILVCKEEKELEKIDGFKAIELLKKDERTKGIPIIIASNLGQEEERQKGLKLGAMDYKILAHCSPSELVEFFKDYLIRTGKFTKDDFSKQKD